MVRKRLAKSVVAANALAAALVGGIASDALAVTEFQIGGVNAVWTTSISVGTSIRAQRQDKGLYSPQNGALTGKPDGYQPNVVDEGNLNYDKGDRFSTLAKVITEVEFSKDNWGGLLRAKAWYDYTLNEEDVNYGNQPNGFNNFALNGDTSTDREPLSDDGFDQELRFDGTSILDAFVYGNFYIGDSALQVRVGKQVLNWGESLYFQGVNVMVPIDVPSFRKPGAELKEVFLPTEMISASLDLPNGDTIEAFYQWKWRETPIEAGCGNYWSAAVGNLTRSPNACGSAITLVPGGSGPAGVVAPAYYGTIDVDAPDDDGQFGIAYYWRPEFTDAEIGFYAAQIHMRTSTLGLAFAIDDGNPNTNPSMGMGTGVSFNSLWEYVEDVEIFGISYAGNPWGWSVSAELTHHKDVPAQLDGNDLLNSSFGAGPLAAEVGALVTQAAIEGRSENNPTIYHGYDLTDKTQFQINALKVGKDIFGGIFGEDQYLFVAEAAWQWNDLDISNKDGSHRYNRGFQWGAGPNVGYGNTSSLCASARNNGGCDDAGGYTTNFAWGYRASLRLQYNNVLLNGLTMFPSLFWSHDVEGYSVDNAILEDRTAINLGLKFEYFKKYTVDFNYAIFGDNADFDTLRDRDFYSVTFGVTF
ncbi:MAG: DUF1302 domain-containing protein [Pseudomonadales bacterium]|nr:DUF1302 domain-containing protein [Pseudomonadales bacterium]MCP5172236.1 DUF1302 domain-containing protein [Pseudomonadales bacterium]